MQNHKKLAGSEIYRMTIPSSTSHYTDLDVYYCMYIFNKNIADMLKDIRKRREITITIINIVFVSPNTCTGTTCTITCSNVYNTWMGFLIYEMILETGQIE